MPGSSQMPVSLRDTFAKDTSGRKRRIVSSNLNLLRNILLVLFLYRWYRKTILQLRGYGLVGSAAQLARYVRRVTYRTFLRLPGVSTKVQAQVTAAITKLEGKLVPSGPGAPERYTALPKEGWGKEQVSRELEALSAMEHARWEDGRVSGAVYHGGKDLSEIQVEAWGKFSVSNPLHPDVFPGVRKMEAEVVSMVLNLFNAPEGAGGVTTSGGTESILMACLSARNKAYNERGIKEPEIILPNTAHAAFLKACEYFRIKYHLVPCPAPTYKVQVKSVAALINSNTCLLVGSAPNFPHGIIDDITALSRLAVRKRIPLHVDCCLGSFLMPLLVKAGFESEPFDFRLPGVTSISVDTHKYGFAPKGNSTVLYRTADLRAHQYFISPDWPGGVYATTSIAGSRPGALIAGCWASMMAVGEAGYVDACHQIVSARADIEEAIRTDARLTPLSVVGRPLVSVVAFRSPELDVYEVADGMSAKGWHLNALQDPPAVHVAVTLPIVPVWRELVDDLAAVTADVVRRRDEALERGEQPKGEQGSASALYGVAGSLPDKSIVKDLARGFLDTLYKT